MTEAPADVPMMAAAATEAATAPATAAEAASSPPVNVPETTKAAERAALTIQKKLNTQALPVRQYLESTVVPLLMQGLQALCKERPDNPVEYLANFLLQHNPQPSQTQTQTQQQQPAPGAVAAQPITP